MGIRGELFSTKVLLKNRTYFFNVKENRLGDLYLNIVESKNRDEGGFDRQSVILFAEDMQEFLLGFDESLKVLEKAAREKKRGAPGRDAPSRRGMENAPSGRNRRDWDDEPASSPRPRRASPMRDSSASSGRFSREKGLPEGNLGPHGPRRSIPERNSDSAGYRRGGSTRRSSPASPGRTGRDRNLPEGNPGPYGARRSVPRSGRNGEHSPKSHDGPGRKSNGGGRPQKHKDGQPAPRKKRVVVKKR
jgi:hypothetical protein